jgi:hypothetical protein
LIKQAGRKVRNGFCHFNDYKVLDGHLSFSSWVDGLAAFVHAKPCKDHLLTRHLQVAGRD